MQVCVTSQLQCCSSLGRRISTCTEQEACAHKVTVQATNMGAMMQAFTWLQAHCMHWTTSSLRSKQSTTGATTVRRGMHARPRTQTVNTSTQRAGLAGGVVSPAVAADWQQSSLRGCQVLGHTPLSQSHHKQLHTAAYVSAQACRSISMRTRVSRHAFKMQIVVAGKYASHQSYSAAVE